MEVKVVDLYSYTFSGWISDFDDEGIRPITKKQHYVGLKVFFETEKGTSGVFSTSYSYVNVMDEKNSHHQRLSGCGNGFIVQKNIKPKLIEKIDDDYGPYVYNEYGKNNVLFEPGIKKGQLISISFDDLEVIAFAKKSIKDFKNPDGTHEAFELSNKNIGIALYGVELNDWKTFELNNSYDLEIPDDLPF